MFIPRQLCAIPIVNGEFDDNPKEWDFFVAQRLLDFMLVYINLMGGITPARKLVVFCKAFSIRIVWHRTCMTTWTQTSSSDGTALTN